MARGEEREAQERHPRDDQRSHFQIGHGEICSTHRSRGPNRPHSRGRGPDVGWAVWWGWGRCDTHWIISHWGTGFNCHREWDRIRLNWIGEWSNYPGIDWGYNW